MKIDKANSFWQPRFRGAYGFDEMPDLFRIKCINKATADAYERHCAIIKANNLTNGKRLSYGVLKK